MYESHPNARSSNCVKWLNTLSTASDKIRLECCPDSHKEPQYIRSIQGHSGAPRIDPTFFTLLGNPYAWKVFIYRTGSSNNYRSIVEGELIAGGTSGRRGRQACFFSFGAIRKVVARFSRILQGRASTGTEITPENGQITRQCTLLI